MNACAQGVTFNQVLNVIQVLALAYFGAKYAPRISQEIGIVRQRLEHVDNDNTRG